MPRFDPTSEDEFTRRLAFFVSVGRSAKVNGKSARSTFLTILTSPTLDPRDRPAVRAARAIVIRGGGKWVNRNTARERADFYNPPK